MVNPVNCQLVIRVQRFAHCRLNDASGHLELIVAGGDIQWERPVVVTIGHRPQRVAHGPKQGLGEKLRDDMELDQLHQLLVAEAVQSPGLEAREGGIGRDQDGEAVARVLELSGDLAGHVGDLEQPKEVREVTGVLEDLGEAWRACGRLGQGLSDDKEDHKWKYNEAVHVHVLFLPFVWSYITCGFCFASVSC
ncbi:hypothetical protein EUGRSUZ_J00937 [Eucalyptus grandis]|uniref:Uncharacterized protein n=2 Tax=Eucalyptus grandis TaxID=71139 RepID=A0ACC3J3R8_EUCGR|nr:hypothetical protein EUGRSUZ_J00937 [Eucalyptus grandis]